MTRATERLDFIARFVTEYPEHGREECVHAAGALIRLSQRRHALAMAECNPPGHWERMAPLRADMLREEWEEHLQRRKDRLLAKVEAVCKPFGLAFTSQGDPRGACIKVKFPTANGTVGVPT